MVGASGFEPPTSWSRTRRSSQAEPRPDCDLQLCNSLLCIAPNRNGREERAIGSVRAGGFARERPRGNWPVRAGCHSKACDLQSRPACARRASQRARRA